MHVIIKKYVPLHAIILHFNTSPRITFTHRYEPELEKLITRYGGEKEMLVQAFALDIKQSAYNERSFQCQQVKMCWLSKINPEFRMAENVLEKELDNDPESTPRVHANLKGTVDGVKELQRLMVSPEFYNNPILFDFFCAGLESGHFRGSKFRSTKTDLTKLITVSHEAHFRTELWFALSKKAFRHNSYKKGNKVRVKKFKEALVAVREGREKYLQDALKIRMNGMVENTENVDDDVESDDACVLGDNDL
jgi:hypothetical protein